MSIIIRTKDRPELLIEAVRSVAAQTYRPIELVVVNDGGCDVEDLISRYGRGLENIRYAVHGRNLGRSGAANTGLRTASGEWIGFLDDDDILDRGAIQVLMAATGDPAVGVVYGKVIHLSLTAEGRVDRTGRVKVFGRPFDRRLLLLQNYIPFIGILWKSSLAAEVGLLDETLVVFEDWEYLVKLSRLVNFCYVPKVTAYYRSFGNSTVSGHRFPPELLEKTEQELLYRWWDQIRPEAVPVFRQFLWEEFHDMMPDKADISPTTAQPDVDLLTRIKAAIG
ncbi:MAG: glycosyltransferase, partial [Deltaproteobacteria bacterium]|nr:glycosyltransferase [Deltaproteobacteria bacterium]